jgi:hypothetical protein
MIGQSRSPLPIGMAFERLKLSTQGRYTRKSALDRHLVRFLCEVSFKLRIQEFEKNTRSLKVTV